MKILLIAYFLSASGAFQIVNFDAGSIQACRMAAHSFAFHHKDDEDFVKIQCLQVQSIEDVK